MATLIRLERCLLPPPETICWKKGALTVVNCSVIQKVIHCVKNFFLFIALLIASPFTLAYDFFMKQKVAPIQKTPDIQPPPPAWPPEQRGFATSLFQTSGLGTKWSASPPLEGKCDWDKWAEKPGHVIHPKGFDFKDFFTDVLSDPTVYIKMLKEQNVTAHRFSLEWSVIEPSRGKIDKQAVDLYRNFIKQLIKAGITPSVTLSHFVMPEWFYEQGNFQKTENIDAFVNFGIKAMELFPEVKDWWSFNELGVKAFQQTREVYPTDVPKGSSLSKRVHAAGIATRNMLIAHCKLHMQVASKYPDKKLGVTHQWLKFDMATGNVMEKLFRYFFEKFGFYPVYNFLKDGKFSFEFPFMANIQFEIPKEEFEANGKFLMQLGVQAYPKAMVKMGLNQEPKPPCGHGSAQTSTSTFGSSCEPGGSIMRFGPRWKAEAMDEILDEAFAITDNVSITEYGSDANVWQSGKPGFAFNDQAQASYLQKLTERVQQYCTKHCKKIGALFCWSDLRRQLEWENGHECKLATIDAIVDKTRRLTGWKETPASKYLASVFKTVEHIAKTA
jgi:beta-glucosidase/6-phospho-beta-glucosidase/beta-galactosidase